jgi:hypothetical protein
LWRYQHSECRFTGYLKDKIEGYDNGRVYNIEQAKKERQEWMDKIKFGKSDANTDLDRLKE